MNDLRDALDQFYQSLHKRRGSGRAGASFRGFRPIKSDALAVHPRQVKEATEDAKKKGVPVDFMPDGRPVFTSRTQRKRYMLAYGFYDKAGGYGDAQPGQFKGSDTVSPKSERELRAEY